jgi:hypothetical protein
MSRASVDRLEAALADIRTALRADGYDMTLRPDEGGRVTIEVTAGPNACAECLIPKDVFARIVARAVDGGAEGVRADDVSIVYPGER